MQSPHKGESVSGKHRNTGRRLPIAVALAAATGLAATVLAGSAGTAFEDTVPAAGATTAKSADSASGNR